MSKIKVTPILFLSFLLAFTSCTNTLNDDDETLYTNMKISTIEKEVIELVNEYRVSKGLNKLEYGTIAYEFAKEHTEYMISEGAISHDNFDIRSSDLSVKANANFVSENVGRNFSNASAVVEAWKNSPAHKKVMEGDFTYTAVSAEADANGLLYFTELFYK